MVSSVPPGLRPGGRRSRAVPRTCLLPPASVASSPRSALGRRSRTWRPRSGTPGGPRPGSAVAGVDGALGCSARPPPSRASRVAATRARPRAGGPARDAHLLDGGLAAAPQPHEQDPWLGAVSAARAAPAAGPRATAATRRCLLFLLLHAVAEVLGERVGCAVTAGQGRLLRPVLQGHGAGPPPPAP